MPSFSPRYEKERALHYQVLHYIFQNSLKFSPIDRWCIKKIKNSLNEGIEYNRLTVSQASALEESDRRIVENKSCISKYKSPLNDGTNSCAFLSIGITDKCTNFSMFDVDKVSQKMTEVITEFPVHFNPYRYVSKYLDIYEAYTILNDNKLLKHHFNFSEKLVDNLHLYSSDVQLKMHTELAELQPKAASENQSKFALFQAHVYIFAIGVFPTREIAVSETHPISLDLHGNGNGIIIKSRSPPKIWQ